MDKISAYTGTADVNDEFTEGDPAQAIQATEVDEGWLNGVQRELLEVMTQMGLTPSSADDKLVWKAVQAIYGKTFSGDPNSNVAANVVRERCWDTSTSPPTLYIATAADGTTGGTTWTRFTDLLRASSTTKRGIVELATNTETQTGTDSQRAVTPAGLASTLGLVGALIPLAEAVASGDAAIDFTSNIDSTYDTYIFIIEKLVPSSTGGAPFSARTSDDGGATWDGAAGDYAAVRRQLAGDATSQNFTNNSNDNIPLMSQVTSTRESAITFILHAPSVNGRTAADWKGVVQTDANGPAAVDGAARRNADQVVDAVRFLFMSGNIASGVFRMYGVKKS